MLAHGFVDATVDRIGIPQNWVVDPQAKWVATIEAFGSDWEGTVVRQLEAVHKSSGTPPAPGPRKRGVLKKLVFKRRGRRSVLSLSS